MKSIANTSFPPSATRKPQQLQPERETTMAIAIAKYKPMDSCDPSSNQQHLQMKLLKCKVISFNSYWLMVYSLFTKGLLYSLNLVLMQLAVIGHNEWRWMWFRSAHTLIQREGKRKDSLKLHSYASTAVHCVRHWLQWRSVLCPCWICGHIHTYHQYVHIVLLSLWYTLADRESILNFHSLICNFIHDFIFSF